jgi:hypothetical protein
VIRVSNTARKGMKPRKAGRKNGNRKPAASRRRGESGGRRHQATRVVAGSSRSDVSGPAFAKVRQMREGRW